MFITIFILGYNHEYFFVPKVMSKIYLLKFVLNTKLALHLAVALKKIDCTLIYSNSSILCSCCNHERKLVVVDFFFFFFLDEGRGIKFNTKWCFMRRVRIFKFEAFKPIPALLCLSQIENGEKFVKCASKVTKSVPLVGVAKIIPVYQHVEVWGTVRS